MLPTHSQTIKSAEHVEPHFTRTSVLVLLQLHLGQWSKIGITKLAAKFLALIHRLCITCTLIVIVVASTACLRTSPQDGSKSKKIKNYRERVDACSVKSSPNLFMSSSRSLVLLPLAGPTILPLRENSQDLRVYSLRNTKCYDNRQEPARGLG